MLERTIILVGEAQRQAAATVLANLPVNGTVQVVFGPKKKVRTLDQNAAMWAGPLKDIAEQAWVDGRQFRAEVWHEFFKRKFLPEDDCEDLARRVTKRWTSKWTFDPEGARVLIGSTTDLSTFGMAEYVTEVEAYATTELGVHLHVNPRQETT